MKNIGFYCCDYYPNQSGYSHAFQAMINGLVEADSDCMIDVFTAVPLENVEEIGSPRINVIRIKYRFQRSKWRALRIFGNLFLKPIKIAKEINKRDIRRNYDYIVFESIEEPLILSFVARSVLKKSVVRIHATSETEYAMWGGGVHQFIRKILIKHHLKHSITNIAATADYYLKFVKKWYLNENQILIAQKRFAVIPNAILSLPNYTTRTFSACGAVRHFVTLGRMDSLGANQKGFDDILEAIRLLSSEERRLVKFTIVGSGSEQERLFEAAMDITGAQFNFITRASNEEVGGILRVADAVVLASRYEGMSIFAMEALAYGAPVIFSNAGGIRDLVEKNGLSFEAGNYQQLSQCIAQFLKLNEVSLEQMSRRSYEVISELSPNYIGHQLARFASNRLTTRR